MYLDINIAQLIVLTVEIIYRIHFETLENKIKNGSVLFVNTKLQACGDKI